MSVFTTLLVAVQVITALAMIGLILMQHGKGADMGAAFGSGASGSLFGASGSANFLSRTTSFLAAIFFVSTLALAYTGKSGLNASGGASVLESAPAGAAVPATPQAPATTAPSAAPAPSIPAQ